MKNFVRISMLGVLFQLMPYVSNSQGNVGIGTTNPAYKLDVIGDINIPFGSTYKVNGISMNFSPWDTIGNKIYYNQGNVGINTTNPNVKFEVYEFSSSNLATIKASGANGPTNGYLGVQGQIDFDNISGLNLTGEEIGVLGISTGGSNTDNYGIYGYSNNIGGRFVNRDSSVSVNLAGRDRAILINQGGKSIGIEFNYGSSTYPTVKGFIKHDLSTMLYDAQSGGSWARHTFQTDGTTRMIIAYDGKVGIGTTTPTHQLSVNTDAFIGGTKIEDGDFIAFSTNGVINCGGSVNSIVNVIGDVSSPVLTYANGDEDLWIQDDLEVVSQAYKTGGGSWSAISDIRLKQNIRPFNDGLEQILQIRPIFYQYNDKVFLNEEDRERTYVGVIAQEMREVAPYMVEEVSLWKKEIELENGSTKVLDPGELFYTYDPSALNYLLVNAVQEQQVMIEAQKEINENLQAQIEVLRLEIAKIKR